MIGNIHLFGLTYNHNENLIPDKVDVLVTHEPPIMILDKSDNIHWGNTPLQDKIFQIKSAIIECHITFFCIFVPG